MTRPRILIVEDEFLIRLTLVEALAEDGFDVAEAATGAEALDQLHHDQAIALLLTDIQLPGGTDGLGLAQAARQANPDLPVIFVTGRPDTGARITNGERNRFILKPYMPSEICEAARSLTGLAH
jgi:CheY-like chemotaxis protein